MARNNTFIKYWLPVILWTGFIYVMSSQPSLKSALDPFWDMTFRKIAHMLEFGIFAFLLSRALDIHRVKGRAYWFLIIFISLFYSVYDEVHQSYVQGRYGTVRDMIIDFNGAILGAIVWNLNKVRKKKKER